MFTHITKKTEYQNALRNIDRYARRNNTSPENAALQIVRNNRKAVEQFVIENGEVPESDARTLAAQALIIHEYKVWDMMRKGVPDYETAENVILAQKQDSEDQGISENFGGEILGSVFKAGRASLDKINEKRIKAGKRPILAGEKGKKLLDKIQAHSEIAVAGIKTGTGEKTAAGVFVNTLSGDIEKQKTKEAIKKYLPYAILILIIVFIAGKHYAK